MRITIGIRRRLRPICSAAVVGTALLVSGCGKDPTDTNVVPAPSTAVPDTSRLNAADLDIGPLLDNDNAVIANNAKELVSAFEQNDYSRAAFAISAIASLRVNAASENAVRRTLDTLSTKAAQAAAKGNSNAKFATNHLSELFN